MGLDIALHAIDIGIERMKIVNGMTKLLAFADTKIEHTPFGWDVRVAKEGCTYYGFNACTDPGKYKIPPGERMDFYMVICPVHGEWCTTFEPTKGVTCDLCGREVMYRLLPWGRANDQI